MNMWKIGIGMICLLFVVSCGSSKKVTPTVKEESSILVPLYEGNFIAFEQLEMTCDVQYDGDGMRIGFSGLFRMHKDSLIWGSFKKFGFEAVRFKMTSDSLFVINRLEKSFMAEDINALKEQLGIALTLYDVQQLLIGGPIWKGNYVQTSDSTLSKTDVMGDRQVQVLHSYQLPELLLANTMITVPQDSASLDVFYNEYAYLGPAQVAYTRDYFVRQKEQEIRLIFNTKEFILNEAKSFPFEIPASYSRTRL